MVKTEERDNLPSLLSFEDEATDSTNHWVTPRSIAKATGHRLRLDRDQDDEVIVFITAADGAAYPVEILQQNKPSQLIFLTPDFPPGLYGLEVRTRVFGSTQPRTGALPLLLEAAVG